jgi:hypothetical protein
MGAENTVVIFGWSRLFFNEWSKFGSWMVWGFTSEWLLRFGDVCED